MFPIATGGHAMACPYGRLGAANKKRRGDDESTTSMQEMQSNKNAVARVHGVGFLWSRHRDTRLAAAALAAPATAQYPLATTKVRLFDISFRKKESTTFGSIAMPCGGVKSSAAQANIRGVLRINLRLAIVCQIRIRRGKALRLPWLGRTARVASTEVHQASHHSGR